MGSWLSTMDRVYLSSVDGFETKYEKASTRNHSHSSSNLAICLTSKDLDRTLAIGSTAFNNYCTTNNATQLWKASNTITYHQPYNLTNIDEEKQSFSFVILETRMIKFAQENYRINLAYWLYSQHNSVGIMFTQYGYRMLIFLMNLLS